MKKLKEFLAVVGLLLAGGAVVQVGMSTVSRVFPVKAAHWVCFEDIGGKAQCKELHR